MRVRCLSNKGFVDNLTIDKYYNIINETQYGYIIEDDLGIIWEYAKDRFNQFNKIK